MTDTKSEKPTPEFQETRFPLNGATPPAHPAMRKETASAPSETSVHPKQLHLNALIHAGIVTHLVTVAEKLDPVFAIAKMRELKGINFAATFDDGLMAFGCTGDLPQSLEDIAEPAVATSPSRPEIAKGLQRIDLVSHRLEHLVNELPQTQPAGQSGLDPQLDQRLAALEAALEAQSQPDPVVASLKRHIEAMHETISTTPDYANTLSAIAAHLATLTAPAIEQAQQDKFDQFTAVITMITQRIEATASDLKQSANRQASTPDTSALEATIKNLFERQDAKMAGLAAPAMPVDLTPVLSVLADLSQQLKNIPAQPPTPESLIEKIDQIGTSQRTTLTRFEAAMTKVISGIEPALDHLNARAADTENMMSDWHTDLKSLSHHTRRIAENTNETGPRLDTITTEVANIANRPAPVLDMTEQHEAFAKFSENLTQMITRIDTFGQNVDTKSGDTAMGTASILTVLQTLPELISATLRHDVDLSPLSEGIESVHDLITTLPHHARFEKITAALVDVSQMVDPLQTLGADQVTQMQTLLSHIQTLAQDVTLLDAKEPDFEPVNLRLANVEQQVMAATDKQDTQFVLVRDEVGQLAQHLGVSKPAGTALQTTAPFVPETSLNTLKMEFADLISKRMQTSDAPLSA